ncbi:unnamed protein product [Ixodes pacificus]
MTLPCQGRTPYTTLLSNRAIRCREDLPTPGIVTLQYATQLQGHERQLQDDTGQDGFPMRKD